jgi:leader peptidase (prepilin peptidase)/N-methyltransferase
LNIVIEELPRGIEDDEEEEAAEQAAREKAAAEKAAAEKNGKKKGKQKKTEPELQKEAEPEESELQKEPEEELRPLRERLTKGRSACPHCGRSWKLKDSLPIFSWLLHKGKCIYCFEKISPRHTLIELFGGILAVIVWLYYGISLSALTVFLVFCVLATISFIDMDTQYIPPELNIILALLGVVSIWTLPGATVIERVIGVFCISVPLILIVLAVPGGFGGGDIKLMAAAGVLLGWKGNVLAFLIGLVLGGAYGVYLLLSKKKGKKEHFAFGPFLSVGIAISLYGQLGIFLLNQYVNLVMLMMQD